LDHVGGPEPAQKNGLHLHGGSENRACPYLGISSRASAKTF
jgi:hypothetical protein